MQKLALVVLALGLLSLGCTTNRSASGGLNSSSLSALANGPGTLPGGANTLQIQTGDTVQVDYVGTLEDGTVFDTSLRNEAMKAGLPQRPRYAPLQFTVGGGHMIAGFEQGVLGMREGEEKTIVLSPAEAYGEVRPDLIVNVTRARLTDIPEDEIAVGSVLQSSSGGTGVITAVSADNVTLDFNHPLAGKTLHFRIMLRNITRNYSPPP